MYEYNILIESVKTDIKNEDLKSLQTNVTRLPLEKLKQNTLDKLLTIFIAQCNEFNSKNSLQIIFDTLYQIIPIESGQLDHITRVFTLSNLTTDQLKMIVDVYPNKSLIYYFNHLINYDSSPLVVIAAKNLELIFKDVDGDIWRYLYNLSITNGTNNMVMQDFLATKVKETSVEIIKPTYNINIYDKIPYEDELFNNIKKIINVDFELPSNDKAIELLKSFYSDINNIYYLQLNDEDKKLLLTPIILSQQRLEATYDLKTFNIYGPVNILPDQDLSGDDICSILGCRLLTCNEYNRTLQDDDSDIENVGKYGEDGITADWFTGTCDYCLNQIPYKHWAVRRPLKTGGFTQCYCSWNCVRADTKSSQEEVMTLIDLFEEQMNELGIQDRLYR